MSSTMARSILRKFSAWRSSLDENGIAAELGDPFDHVRDLVAEQLLDLLDRGRVSSTMSCSRPAATATTSSFMSARRSATSSGWTR